MVELLVVIAIIAVLAAIAFPMANKMIARSHTAKCAQNVTTLIRAIHAFAADNNGGLPYASNNSNPGAKNLQWWHKEIMPYLGYDWDQLIPNSSAPYEQGTGSWLPDIFRCPADNFWGKSLGIDPSYGINHNLCGTVGGGGGFPPKFWGATIPNPPRTRIVTVPNPSKMILLADGGHQEEDGGVAWRIGLSQPAHGFSARHDGYGTVGWLDGHVTLESEDRLDELHKEKRPWASWLPPHMAP